MIQSKLKFSADSGNSLKVLSKKLHTVCDYAYKDDQQNDIANDLAKTSLKFTKHKTQEKVQFAGLKDQTIEIINVGKKRTYKSKLIKSFNDRRIKAMEKIKIIIKSPGMRSGLFVITGLCSVLFLLLASLSSCSVLSQRNLNSVLSSSYLSEDEDMVQVEKEYSLKEKELMNYIDRIETIYPDYDEYHYQVDKIRHDAHELASWLTVIHQIYKPEDVSSDLTNLYDRQYMLSIEEHIEVRYRIETHEEIITDPVTGEITIKTEDIEVPYEYKVLNVKLKSQSVKDAIWPLLTDDQKEWYVILIETKGNRADLF